MAEGVILPIIVNIEGSSDSAALMNQKAYSKSVETKKLWIVHPETERVIPWAGDPSFLSLKEESCFYSAELPLGSETTGFYLNNEKEDPELHEDIVLNSFKDYDSIILYKLAATIKKRKDEMPSGSYTTHLFEKGMEKIKKKTGEEAIELILAESKEDILYESADLIYHLLVLLEEAGVPFHDLMMELERRDN